MFSEVSKWQTASRLLQEVQNAYDKLDHVKLKNEKYKLLNEIGKIFEEVEVKKGDFVDFGPYGKLYILKDLGDKYWATDEEEDRYKPNASGWYIDKSLAKRNLDSGKFNESFKKFFAQEIPSYKVYASLYSLMESNKNNFDKKTALLPELVAQYVISKRSPKLSNDEVNWFISHTDKRTRKSYEKNPTFANQLNSNKGKDYLIGFINHWLDSYEKNPQKYKQKYENALDIIDEQYDISQKVKLEEVVINHLLDNKEIHRINEFAKKSKSEFSNIDDLTYAFVIKKFNQRYNKVLSEGQKEILKQYIESTSDKVFEVFVNKKVKNIENELYEEIKKVKDKNILQKLYESMLKFSNINSFNKEKKVECLLSYNQLIEELKK